MTRRSPGRPRRSGCPIAITLDLLGDQWSLLVVRDLMFHGRRTFGEFAAAGEGVATNILTERLERLEAAGIIARTADPADRRRRIYCLTAKGIDLAPVLVEMVLWAARHERTDAPRALVARMRRDRAGFLEELRRTVEPVSAPARARPRRPGQAS